MTDVLELLKELNISFEILEHEAVYTVEQAERIVTDIAGTGCKNLFLTAGFARADTRLGHTACRLQRRSTSGDRRS